MPPTSTFRPYTATALRASTPVMWETYCLRGEGQQGNKKQHEQVQPDQRSSPRFMSPCEAGMGQPYSAHEREAMKAALVGQVSTSDWGQRHAFRVLGVQARAA